MKTPFLLEIGSEEIPHWMIEPALAQLQEMFGKLLADNRLTAGAITADATPRRLVLTAEGVLAQQADIEELVSGPPKAAPAGAVQGFAKKQGVTPEQLETVTTAKGEYYAFRKKVAGRSAKDILAESLPAIILKIEWPKAMYWTAKAGPRFIRPIRWLVALLGDDVVPFEIAGVRSGNASYGHRQLGRGAFRPGVINHEEQYRANGVILSAVERRRKIEAEAAALLPAGHRIKADEDLYQTLVYITEWPTSVLGRFDPKYLELPAEVLVTVMRHHQKYLSVEDADGKLAPCFVAVMNTSADPDGLVVAGNERVLRARFNDARFFWETDQKKPIADRVQDLAHVTFQAKLGSYLEKTERVEKLVAELGGSEHAQRAARLAKTDLTTEMVKEFTELQGVVGGLYARAQGEPAEVAQAIYEHYKPVSMEDSIPSTRAGQILSLADKLDTLRGCFAIDLIPSGSRDPLALRRAAQGVVKILTEAALDLTWTAHLNGDKQLEEFLLDRVRYYFRDVRGFKYDEVSAALAAGYGNLGDVHRRLEALQSVRPTENFEPLAASFKRIKNILRQAAFDGDGEVRTELLEAGPETDLHGAFVELRQRVETHRAAADYRAALESIASLRPKVDLFFDKVLVNAPDARVRENRLTLLARMLHEFSSIADFSEIVTS